MYENLRAKKFVKFDQDIYALTYLSFMKSSVKKFRIDKKKHSQLLASLVVIFVIQVALMIAMVTADETDVST